VVKFKVKIMTKDYEKILKGIGWAIRRIRIEKGYSQAEFGKMTGRKQSAIGKIERGPVAGIPLNVIYEVAQAAGVSLAELFKEAEAYANQAACPKEPTNLLKNLEMMPLARREGLARILQEILLLLPTTPERNGDPTKNH
jgi:transcriptional regulator with XRE-family HTH domain